MVVYISVDLTSVGNRGNELRISRLRDAFATPGAVYRMPPSPLARYFGGTHLARPTDGPTGKEGLVLTSLAVLPSTRFVMMATRIVIER